MIVAAPVHMLRYRMLRAQIGIEQKSAHSYLQGAPLGHSIMWQQRSCHFYCDAAPLHAC